MSLAFYPKGPRGDQGPAGSGGTGTPTTVWNTRTPSQSGSYQIRAGDILLPSIGTPAPIKTWGVTGGTGQAAFITALVLGASSIGPVARTGAVTVATGTTSVTPVEQSDSASADWQICALITRDSTITPVAPVGDSWAQLSVTTYGGAGGFTFRIYGRTRGGSGPSLAFTGAGATQMLAACLSYGNVVTAGPLDAITSTSGLSGTSLSNTSPAQASRAANDMALVIGAFGSVTGTITEPAATSGGGGAGIAVQDDGSDRGTAITTINFGTNLTVSTLGSTSTVNGAVGGGTGGGGTETFHVDDYVGNVAYSTTYDAIQACIVDAAAAISANSGAVVQFGRGPYTLAKAGATYLAIPGNLANEIRMQGNGTEIKLTSTTPAAFGPGSTTADGTTIQNITIQDFIVDMQSAAPNVVGGVIWTMFHRNSVDNIKIRRCKTLNVPISAANSGRRNVDFTVAHDGPTDTRQFNMTNLLVEDCVFNGGNTGVLVQGYTAAAFTVTDQFNAHWPDTWVTRVWGDNITIRRCWWQRSTNPPGGFATSTGYMVGQYAFVDRVLIEDCVALNGADNNFEMDTIRNLTMRRCVAQDGYGGGGGNFYFSNLAGTYGNMSEQKIVLEDCESRGESISTTGVASGFNFQSLSVGHGHVTLDRCKHRNSFSVFTGDLQSLTIRNHRHVYSRGKTWTAFNQGFMSNYPAPFQMGLTAGRGQVTIDGLVVDLTDWNFTSTAAGSGLNFNVFYLLHNSDYDWDVRGVSVKAGAGYTGTFQQAWRLFALFPSSNHTSINEPWSALAGVWLGAGWVWDSGAVADYQVVSGAINGVSNLTTELRGRWIGKADEFVWRYVGPQTDNEVNVTGQIGATTPTGWKMGAIAKAMAADTYIEAYLADNGTITTLNLDKVVAGVRTALIAPVTTTRAANGTNDQVKVKIIKDTLTAQHLRTAAVQQTLTMTLSAADQQVIGSAVQGLPGFSFVPADTTAIVGTVNVVRKNIMSANIRDVNLLTMKGINGGGATAGGVQIFHGEKASTEYRIKGLLRFHDSDLTGAENAPSLARIAVPAAGDSTINQKVLAQNIQYPPDALPASATITPGASAYTYTNNDGYAEDIAVYSGTVSLIEISRAGAAFGTIATSTGIMVNINPGDQIRVTYSVVPTMRKVPRP